MAGLNMRSDMLVWLAALGSVALLGGAFGFQYFGGLAPCEMCIWQRWPHALAFVLGALAMVWAAGRRALALLGAAVMTVSAGLGLFHAGVERKWWEGVTECSVAQGDLSTDALLDAILNAPVVRCDQVAWEMFGLSMASWNGVISLVLAGLWIVVAALAAKGR
jgi:disulfide bond formation protein DsbB